MRLASIKSESHCTKTWQIVSEHIGNLEYDDLKPLDRKGLSIWDHVTPLYPQLCDLSVDLLVER